MKLLLLAIAVTVFATSLAAQQGATGGEWRYYGGDNGATGYSPLDQINRENVGELTVAWRWNASNFGPRPEGMYQTRPIMVGGVLYATAGSRRAAVAIDAGTGETLWMYRLDEGARGETAPRRSSGRGVAYWTDGQGDGRILLVTPGYQLVALDAATGGPIQTFGKHGVVDLKQGLDRQVDPVKGIIGSSSPPVVVGDVVVVGASLARGLRPPSMENVPGHVRGYDVRTGERLWIFHTIPQAGEFGNETWEDDSWSYTGNAAVWPPFSADNELGYVYLPIEAATSDYYGGHRPGDNLFSTSLVCLDARTGERVWHYQIVHHDIWDYDNPAAPILVDITVDGRPIKAVVQLTKQAFAFVFDRVTGEPVWPIEERPMAQSDVPGEQTAATQPFPTRPTPFDRQGVAVEDLIDFTPELRAEAIELIKPYRLGPLFTPASLAESDDGTRGTLSLPSTTGGANWEGGAVDVEEGVLYVGSATQPVVLAMEPDPERSDLNYVVALTLPVSGPQKLPLIKPPYGRITAIDLNTGEHVWMVPNGDTPAWIANHPALEGVEIPRTGNSSRAGVLVTKTLLFAGEGAGGDPMFRAYDKQTGEIVAEIELPAPQTGVPMTYLHEGRQYIVMSVAGGDRPAQLVALAVREARRGRRRVP